MLPRRLIINNTSLTHVYFRCHNQSHLLRPAEVKKFLLRQMSKYKQKYKIEIYDFILMDNHAHFIIRTPSAEALGNYMRTVNSQLARFINRFFGRDSQAIRERYKSPLITNTHYLVGLMQYIWLNRYEVNKKMRPENDPFCSAYWRLRKPYKYKQHVKTEEDSRNNLLATLLDSYDKLEIYVGPCEKTFIRKLIEKGIKEISKLTAKIYEHSHTIGDEIVLKFRTELLSAFLKIREPP